jgi:hypothetical protein
MVMAMSFGVTLTLKLAHSHRTCEGGVDHTGVLHVWNTQKWVPSLGTEDDRKVG